MNLVYYVSTLIGYEMNSFGSILEWDLDFRLRHKFKIESWVYPVAIRA
jgi:hypothetical protein